MAEEIEPRFFMDHGMIHDRVKGCHVTTDDAIQAGATQETFAMLQGMEAELAELRSRLKALEADAGRLDRTALDCAALLRRWCYQAGKSTGDNSFKVLKGQTDDYLRRMGLQGNPLRDDAARTQPPPEAADRSKP